MSQYREKVVLDYARWTAMSALRSGSPVKSRAAVYGLLDEVDFPTILRGSKRMTNGAFDAWHEASVRGMRESQAALGAGWSAKILNVYLKTSVYLAGLGRPGLVECIHPPIDTGLRRGLKRRFANMHDLLAKTNRANRIKDLCEYEDYAEVIAGCRMAAAEMRCLLVEVDHLWDGSETPKA